MANSPLTVLGVDPGSRCLGWGVVREISGVLSLVDCGTLRPKGDGFSERLGALFLGLSRVLARYAPAEAAIENVFTHKNILSALKLGQARGVAVAACAAHGVPVLDYEATLIKKTLTGAGRAEKGQVSFMVGRLLGRKPDWSADAGDALGCAVCHLTMRRMKRLTAIEQRAVKNG
ncbi:MAG: crossover junction endodeoxyribonuclease RuvC [Desulfovibrio sp.]|jgi:crossover junction endodeoxyribonuclease RuvC|nr:crossover junction endodeoxyribonuclease RuvC [Desulfovibrio sp.]